MSDGIKDGTGSGHRVKVDTDHRLWSRAMSVRHMTAISEDKESAYVISSNIFDVIASEYMVLWMKNEDAAHHLHVERIWISWNGGNTNWNRPLYIRFYGGTPEPSANADDVTPLNLYAGSSKTADVLAKQWDGVGGGMTVAANGGSFGIMMARQGLTPVEMLGSVIIPKGQIFAATLEGAEPGKVSLGLTYWMEEPT